jgi:hypothetical protein
LGPPTTIYVLGEFGSGALGMFDGIPFFSLDCIRITVFVTILNNFAHELEAVSARYKVHTTGHPPHQSNPGMKSDPSGFPDTRPQSQHFLNSYVAVDSMQIIIFVYFLETSKNTFFGGAYVLEKN